MNKFINIKTKFLAFVNGNTSYPYLTIFAAGTYPFFRYYSNNISIATSIEQFVFILSICFLVPPLLLLLSTYILKIKIFKPLKPFSLAILNLSVFGLLIGFLVLNLNRKILLVVFLIAFALSFLASKFLKKVVVIQFLLAIMGLVSFIPKLWFQLQHNNKIWITISEETLHTKFLVTPNIFVIQPDGYVNISKINEAPYSFDNSEFETWLISKGFNNYSDFRSNYYSTYTSNASLFAMKHHYYSNTNKATLKTHNVNDVIVGEQNNALKILKNNGYKTHLVTDNSYFLLDRIPLFYDSCNIKNSQLPFHDSGLLHNIDMISDFEKTLDTLQKDTNFFFIEKTVPSHIRYSKSTSQGVENERLNYLNRIEMANVWLKNLIENINKFDENAMIIIVADHGGFVGLNYTLEVLEKQLNSSEANSVFSSMLSIKYPKEVDASYLSYTSSVNLFRDVFYSLSKNEHLLKTKQEDASYLPLRVNGNVKYYKYLNGEGITVFEEVTD